MKRRNLLRFVVWLVCPLGILSGIAACSHQPAGNAAANVSAASASVTSSPAQSSADAAPPPAQTGGFDGQAAYDFTAKLVAFGPRPPGSDAIHKTQEYIASTLQSFGCKLDQRDFHASTPIGEIAMKNIIAKIPGTGPDLILLLTHYDTLRMENFVGAVDAGSSSGLMLELAHILCADKSPQRDSVWIAFLDGEEAQVDWNKDNDNTYGARELAAELANSGEIKRVRAVLLADMVGPKGLVISKDSNSTPWLTNLVWKTAARLGYGNIFLNTQTAVSDDHQAFLARGVPSVDVIDLTEGPVTGYWHTTDDTMDKVSPRSLAIVGHVFLESVRELQLRAR